MYPVDEIQDFKLTCAPYLAIRTLRQLATDESNRFPLGAAAIIRDFYVDDLLSGADTVEIAKRTQKEIISLLKTGGFEICKWSSNVEEINENVALNDREICETFFDGTVKTLGLNWSPTYDQFVVQQTQNQRKQLHRNGKCYQQLRGFSTR